MIGPLQVFQRAALRAHCQKYDEYRFRLFLRRIQEGIVGNGLFQFGCCTHYHLRAKTEFLRKTLLDLAGDQGRACFIAGKYHVSALNIGHNLPEPQRFMQAFEFVHRDDTVSANIDAAKKCYTRSQFHASYDFEWCQIPSHMSCHCHARLLACHSERSEESACCPTRDSSLRSE